GLLGPVLQPGRSRLRPTSRAKATSTTVDRRRRRPGAQDRRPLSTGDQHPVLVARESEAAQRFPCAGLRLTRTCPLDIAIIADVIARTDRVCRTGSPDQSRILGGSRLGFDRRPAGEMYGAAQRILRI